MKKSTLFILLILSFLCFSSCSDASNNSQTTQNTTEVVFTFSNRTTTEKQILESSIYEKVCFEMFGTKVNADVTKELNDQLEKSKTIKEPVLDASMKEIGSVWVQYKNSDELIEFGKIYSGNGNNMYIQAFENEYNGVLLISDEAEGSKSSGLLNQ